MTTMDDTANSQAEELKVLANEAFKGKNRILDIAYIIGSILFQNLA